MAPVYGNMANLCLLCANAQNPGEPFIDILGKRGKQFRIFEKIHKLLSIKQIATGFPRQVCAPCVIKLNVFHEFVQSVKKTHERLKSLQVEWETNPSTVVQEETLDEVVDNALEARPETVVQEETLDEVVDNELEARPESEVLEEPFELEDMDGDWSQIDVYDPSTEANCPTESQELETDLQPAKESQMESTVEIVKEKQSEERPILRQPFYVVKGSKKFAIVVAQKKNKILAKESQMKPTEKVVEEKQSEERSTLRQPFYVVKGSQVVARVVVEEETKILANKCQIEPTEKIVEKNQSEDYPMLQQPFYVMKGSQIAIFVAKEDTEILYRYKLGLVLINLDADCANNKEKITEKISRAMQHAKKRFATEEEQHEQEGTSSSSSSTSIKLLHSCQSCKCSFFLQEEMVSHFDSLHPEQVHQCAVCDEKICGPVQVQEKHKDLHRALEEGQTDDLLSTLRVPSGRIKLFQPEFVIIPLGNYPHYLYPKTDEMLQAKFINIINTNFWIKPDMRDRLSHSLKLFISKVKLYVIKVRKPKLEKQKRPRHKCDECGHVTATKKRLERHMENKHNPNQVKCCHCNRFYLSHNEHSHIESYHNGGTILGCKICDSKFSTSGDDQFHMIPKSDFPFKCPATKCKKAYCSEENLESHRQTVHVSQPGATQSLCELCGRVYKDKNIMKAHMRAVHFPKAQTDLRTCEFCGLTFTKTALLTFHRIRQHDPKVACKVCGKIFDAFNLKRHMKKVHIDEPKYACKYCGKLFKVRENCRVHELSLHEGVQLKCSICKYMSFKTVKALEEHKLKHERGEEIILPRYMQPVQCSICLEVFENAVILYHHKKWHKRTGSDAAPPEMKHKYTRGDGMQRTKPRVRLLTFPCHVCLIRFMTKESYDHHVETHHPDGVPKVSVTQDLVYRYQCRHCDKTFRKKDFCNDHETTHGSGKKYACDYCGKKYSYYSDKWTHQKKKCTARPQDSGSNQ